jgi:hypothetical protein
MQETSHIFWNSEIHYSVTKSPLLEPVLSQTNPVCATNPVCFRSNLLPSSYLSLSSNWAFVFTEFCMYFLAPPYVLGLQPKTSLPPE